MLTSIRNAKFIKCIFLKCLSPLFVFIFNQATMAEDQEFPVIYYVNFCDNW